MKLDVEQFTRARIVQASAAQLVLGVARSAPHGMPDAGLSVGGIIGVVPGSLGWLLERRWYTRSTRRCSWCPARSEGVPVLVAIVARCYLRFDLLWLVLNGDAARLGRLRLGQIQR